MSPVVSSLSDFLSHTARSWSESVTPRSTLRSSKLPLIDEVTGGGFPLQATTEIFTNQTGYGEIKLLLPTLAAFEHVTWILNPANDIEPYGPAFSDAGLDLNRQLFVVPPTADDAFWAAEQAALSGETQAVVVWLHGLQKTREHIVLPRLMMAAQSTGTTLFLLRPMSAICLPSAAPLRLQLTPAPMGKTSIRAIQRGTFFNTSRCVEVALADLDIKPNPTRASLTQQLSLDLFSLPTPAMVLGSHQA